ncbi:MAG: thioredoxin [Pseudonocardiaceae bacterium]|nr:thioredoxin [Pseudonocardiaceae bacterium]
MTGVWVALVTIAVAVLIGLLWQARQGRIRNRATALPPPVRAWLAEAGPHDGPTLVMLSTPVCARCPQARAVLRELAGDTPSIRRLELDLDTHPALADELGVRSTPTTLAVSRSGHELFRVAGVPRRAELREALAPHL